MKLNQLRCARRALKEWGYKYNRNGIYYKIWRLGPHKHIRFLSIREVAKISGPDPDWFFEMQEEAARLELDEYINEIRNDQDKRIRATPNLYINRTIDRGDKNERSQSI